MGVARTLAKLKKKAGSLVKTAIKIGGASMGLPLASGGVVARQVNRQRAANVKSKKAPGMVGTMISTAGTIAGTIVGKAPVQKSHLVGGRGYRRKHKKITMKDLMDLQMLKHALGVKDLTKGVGGIIITQKLMKKILH